MFAYFTNFYRQGRNQRGARGARPPDKVLAPAGWPGAVYGKFPKLEIFNRNTSVHIKKNSLASTGFAPNSYMSIYKYVTTLEQL